MSEHLHFCSARFTLQCNDLILFCCMMVLLMTTGQSSVLLPKFVYLFCKL